MYLTDASFLPAVYAANESSLISVSVESAKREMNGG